MPTPAIRVEGLGKKYRLTHGQDRDSYRTLRDSITDFAKAPFRKRGTTEEFWALNDVSFEVQPGEVVGIIGRNGAGKSTLLKILSRITKPTKGRVVVNGRVGSLLEVGTGFHPELTGRENVYLNGSILGMSRSEIAKKFDEIVAFAEVEKFLDTPVKRYSSGMYVRLAFAVAAHLEPEILIVDEVLAVGDAGFQKKCIDQISKVASNGKTVLLVSHNMQLIPKLCRNAIQLHTGRIAGIGSSSLVTRNYLDGAAKFDDSELLDRKSRIGDGRARFHRAILINENGDETTYFISGHDLIVQMEVVSNENIENVSLAVIIQCIDGTRLITSWSKEIDFPVRLTAGVNKFECVFKDVMFRPSHKFKIGLWVADSNVIDSVDDALVVEIVGDSSTNRFVHNPDQGIIIADYRWRKV
jgi:lipopolysaccharide transport system ATP-binding protein